MSGLYKVVRDDVALRHPVSSVSLPGLESLIQSIWTIATSAAAKGCRWRITPCG